MLDKTARMRELREVIGAGIIRARENPGAHMIIQNTLTGMNTLAGRLEEPDLLIALLRDARADFSKLIATLTTSNNQGVRIQKLASQVFTHPFEECDELEIQISKVREVARAYIEMMVVMEYCDDAGTISWSRLTERLSRALVEGAVAAERGAAQARGLGM